MFAAQFGHHLPGCVIQVSRPFIIHGDRQDPAGRHRIQILDQTLTLFLESVGVKPTKGRDRILIVLTAAKKTNKNRAKLISFLQQPMCHPKVPRALVFRE